MDCLFFSDEGGENRVSGETEFSWGYKFNSF